MKEDTPERPFLAYANYSLKGNPRNLHKIFDSIEHYYTVPEAGRAYIRRVVDTIIELSGHNDPEIIAKYQAVPVIENADSSKESEEDIEFDGKDIQEAIPENQIIIPKQVPNPDIEITRRIEIETEIETINNIAIEAVYGYRDGFCENKCTLRDLITKELGQNVFSGPERPKCYECYQTNFIRMLSILALKQWPYEWMPDLMEFLNNSRRRLKAELQIVNQQLDEVVIFRADDPFFFGAITGGPPEVYKSIFRDFLHGLIGNDLTEFLLTSENGRSLRNRLHKCEYCGTFFVADTFRKRRYCDTCSPKSKMTGEKRRNYMARRRAKERKLRIARAREEHKRRCVEAGMTERDAEISWKIYKEENRL